MTLHGNVDMPPGTELMAEDGAAKKTLIPHPTSDPQDPLNWSTAWKGESHTPNPNKGTFTDDAQSQSWLANGSSHG